jgi:hypothetical protein
MKNLLLGGGCGGLGVSLNFEKITPGIDRIKQVYPKVIRVSIENSLVERSL